MQKAGVSVRSVHTLFNYCSQPCLSVKFDNGCFIFFSSILVVLLRSCSMPLSLYVSLTWIFFSNKAYYLYLCLQWTALFIACILLAGSFLLFWTNPLIMLISTSFLLYLHFITWNYSLPFRVKFLPIFQSLDKLVTSHEVLVQLFLHQWCTH